MSLIFTLFPRPVSAGQAGDRGSGERMTAQVITINDSSRDHNQYIIMIALRSPGLILCEGEADRGSQGRNP